jgi:hypothetical protein
MYKNFTLTESEREQILNMHKDKGYKQPMNEQSTDDTIIGTLPSKLGLNPSQVLKDTSGNVVGKLYMGNDGNKGYTVKIMNNSNDAIVFDPTLKGSKTMSLQQVVTDFKSRTHQWISGMVGKENTPQPENKYMSDDDVAKLNASIKY